LTEENGEEKPPRRDGTNSAYGLTGDVFARSRTRWSKAEAGD
jgi:hypothetical protein